MTIQLPDVGTGAPADKTGDSPWLAMKKVQQNFSDQTNAASRLLGTGAEQVPLSKNIPSLLGTAATKDVGTAAGNVMEVGAFGIGGTVGTNAGTTPLEQLKGGNYSYPDESPQRPSKVGLYDTQVAIFPRHSQGYGAALFLPYYTASSNQVCLRTFGGTTYSDFYFWTDRNATKDANGFLKGASPVVDMYDNKIDLNQDAEQQGGITFEKVGVGDYLVKGSLGFAQEGWYIEMPKDANGNVLVAVVYEQLENNDISIKTYAKRFDDETGDIVANLAKPRDIPDGRFISLRLHELPKESPVMPTNEPTTGV